ncbi:hypothetical protein EYF80_027914 [Liparis tanakae]|uniref:Uncharacterized protein n=1 Tax=Liparis tanakae TaxID=230148 RepID=A0A4Z2H7I7_9TELE|nr:hypothetical protein EYF80_027914 [Liparis tanakae]
MLSRLSVRTSEHSLALETGDKVPGRRIWFPLLQPNTALWWKEEKKNLHLVAMETSVHPGYGPRRCPTLHRQSESAWHVVCSSEEAGGLLPAVQQRLASPRLPLTVASIATGMDRRVSEGFAANRKEVPRDSCAALESGPVTLRDFEETGRDDITKFLPGHCDAAEPSSSSTQRRTRASREGHLRSSKRHNVEPGGGARYMCRSWLMCERVSPRPRSSTALLHAAPNS